MAEHVSLVRAKNKDKYSTSTAFTSLSSSCQSVVIIAACVLQHESHFAPTSLIFSHSLYIVVMGHGMIIEFESLKSTMVFTGQMWKLMTRQAPLKVFKSMIYLWWFSREMIFKNSFKNLEKQRRKWADFARFHDSARFQQMN